MGSIFDKRYVLAVELTWNAMLDLENRYRLIWLWDFLTMKELQSMKGRKRTFDNYKSIANSYNLSNIKPLDDSVERMRPFLQEPLYDIFSVHRIVVIRTSIALHGVVCEQSDKHWSTDRLLCDALEGIVDLDEPPSIGNVTEKIKRTFCVVYSGAGIHTPSDEPRRLGYPIY